MAPGRLRRPAATTRRFSHCVARGVHHEDLVARDEGDLEDQHQ